MRLIIAAVGRIGASPEATRIAEFGKRIDGLARQTGLGPLRLLEIDERAAQTSAAQGAQLARAAGDARRVVLDERGQSMRSVDFAKRLIRFRDQGAPSLAFLIGGADGHDAKTRNGADLLLSLGEMTWPHALARLMLIEQLYRAATIAIGHPYHREG